MATKNKVEKGTLMIIIDDDLELSKIEEIEESFSKNFIVDRFADTLDYSYDKRIKKLVELTKKRKHDEYICVSIEDFNSNTDYVVVFTTYKKTIIQTTFCRLKVGHNYTKYIGIARHIRKAI